MRPELRNRLIIGPMLGGTMIAALAWDFASGRHWGMLLILTLAMPFGLVELRRLASLVAGPVQVLPSIVISWLLLWLTWVTHDGPALAWLTEHAPRLGQGLATRPYGLVVLTLGMLWVVAIQMWRRAQEHFFSSVALSVFGMIYLGTTCSILLALTMVTGEPDLVSDVTAGYTNRGNQFMLLLLASCKLGDVAAYFGGRAFGRNKMAPRISPGKTWEGFAASFIGSIGGAYAMTAILTACCSQAPFQGWWQPAVWGLLLGPLGVIGDLAESCMKREANVKDSGTTLPGFGGWLDVFDAVILAAPVGYVLALIL